MISKKKRFVLFVGLDTARGNIAADELAKAGFNVKNLEGGFMAWQKA